MHMKTDEIFFIHRLGFSFLVCRIRRENYFQPQYTDRMVDSDPVIAVVFLHAAAEYNAFGVSFYPRTV